MVSDYNDIVLYSGRTALDWLLHFDPVLELAIKLAGTADQLIA
jgi:hypothetical protein